MDTTQAILDALRCVGADRGTVYVTVPITTGIREFRLMRELGCTRQDLRSSHRGRWEREVKLANEADAEAYSLLVQLQNADRLVLNPAALQVVGWTQEHYGDMWSQVLNLFCDKLVVTPEWAFSTGARHEVQQMFVFGREVVDVFGRRFTREMLTEADQRAKDQLMSMGWSLSEVETLLPPLRIPRNTPPPQRFFEMKDFNSTLKWLMDERLWQMRTSFKDRDRTVADGPKSENGQWRTLLDKYFSRARAEDPKSAECGQYLLVYVSLAVTLMEQVMAVFGSFPTPGTPSGEEVGVDLLSNPEIEDNQRLALVLTWLLREFRYLRDKYPEEEDDNHTREGFGEDSWWHRQLNLYWIRAHKQGLDTLKGRQALAKFTSTSLGMVTSWVRLHGLPEHPKRRTAEELRQRGLFD